MQKVTKVISYTWEEGAKGAYMKASLDPGHADKERNYAVFEDAHQKLIEKAHENNTSLMVEFEKKGDFWNVSKVEVMDGLPAPEKTTTGKPTPRPSGDAGRERSMALSYSKDMVVSGKIEAPKVLAYAEVFYQYIIGNLTVKDEDTFKTVAFKFFEGTE